MPYDYHKMINTSNNVKLNRNNDLNNNREKKGYVTFPMNEDVPPSLVMAQATFAGAPPGAVRNP